MPAAAKLAGELSWSVCVVGLRMVVVVMAAGAGSGRCGGWVADDGAWCDPGLVGVSAMP